jgi:hypothetical protein
LQGASLGHPFTAIFASSLRESVSAQRLSTRLRGFCAQVPQAHRGACSTRGTTRNWLMRMLHPSRLSTIPSASTQTHGMFRDPASLDYHYNRYATTQVKGNCINGAERIVKSAFRIKLEVASLRRPGVFQHGPIHYSRGFSPVSPTNRDTFIAPQPMQRYLPALCPISSQLMVHVPSIARRRRRIEAH